MKTKTEKGIENWKTHKRNQKKQVGLSYILYSTNGILTLHIC